MNAIEINQLTKCYGSLTAVDHISFSVEQRELLGFLGVNGAGKSTTINMLSTLIAPDGGTASICGCELGKQDEAIRRRIGIVSQQNCLDDLLTVRENLLCRGMLHGASRSGARERLSRLCRIFTLEELLHKRYRTLSGGQKRRCEIAAALMHTPEILFLDEPTTGLDPATRKEVWETIETLRRSTNMTVFLTTHYMEEAARAGRIVIISKGRILAQGTPHGLKEQYAADTLKLYCSGDRTAAIAARLARKGYTATVVDAGLQLTVSRTMDALPLLEELRDRISGFEVVQGTMDDVFLKVVGKEGGDDHDGIC